MRGRGDRRGLGVLGSVAAGTLLASATLALGPGPAAMAAESAPRCLPAPSEYYRVDLVPTRTVPGTARTTGSVELAFVESPYGVDLATDGSYRYRLDLEVEGLPTGAPGTFVAWVSTPRLDEVTRLGALDPDGRTRGFVAWNKFLVFVTLESEAGAETFSGPVVLRGLSRSGLMHTMAGHGPFESENCAAYGY